MQNFFEILPQNRETAVALGYFDGVHLGHRKVLSLACNEKANGLKPVCFTFSQSPKSVLGKSKNKELMTKADKLNALETLGIECVYQADFSMLMDMSAGEFFERILVDKLKAKKLFCGFNYHFGKNGEGNPEMLTALCRQFGITLCVIPPTLFGGEVVSSTLIKSLISNGEIKKANEMLCSSFGFAERIEHGRRLGRELGTPTLNQPLKSELVVPRFGVYCSAVTLQDGSVYCGVTNIGVKPTVGSNAPICETWMPEYQGGEIYGQVVDIRLIEFIRAERKFETLTDLKNTIIENGKTALLIFETTVKNQNYKTY